MSDCLQIQNVEISKCGSYIQSNEDGKLARVENIYKQNKAKQEEPQCCHFPPPSATRSLRQKDSKSNGLYSIVITLAKKRNQRTNGPVNAHLLAWPSKAQNIQNLENIW